MNRPKMKIITIITMDKCNAQCTECCFQCSPLKDNVLTLKEMKKFILECFDSFSELETVVFSGGECTLLKNDLFEIIKFCKSLKLATRIVTNGFWGKTEKMALRMANNLKEAGLDEVNFSTGDNHQVWVPYDSIVNAIVACQEYRLYTVVSIEAHNSSKFNRETALAHPKIKEIMNNEEAVQPMFFEAVWIPFNDAEKLTYGDVELDSTVSGCDNILEFLGLYPDKSIKGCCGLTVDYIDEMVLGTLYEDNLKEIFLNQLNDFMKIWLWVDGPQYIYEFALSKMESNEANERFVHPCQFCAEVYNSEMIKRSLAIHWEEKVDEVMFRYNLKLSEHHNKMKEVLV